MATFMEKDVLIECISTALGLTAYNNNLDHPARIELLELRNKLYGMEPEEINYKEELSFIKDKKAILESISCSDPKKLDFLFRVT